MIFPRNGHPYPASAEDRRRPHDARKRPKPREVQSHLPLVMSEIAELMGAVGAILTIHSSNGALPTALYVDRRLSEHAQAAMLQNLTVGIRSDFDDDQCFWREIGASCMLVLPVERLAGHGRLVISMFFENVGPEERLAAEQLYRERKPFAIGFFQLWQHNRLLQQRARSLEAVLDHTAIGLVMIDRSGRLLFANQTAGEILAAGDGIGRRDDMLRATSLIDGVNLQAALSHAIAGDAEPAANGPLSVPLLAFRRKHGPPLIAAVLPAASSGVEDGDVAAIMYLVDPQIDTAKMLSPLCRLYGLSPVETALVCHLAAGETIASAAQQMHIKEPTARSYLKTIFIKTATKRQTELVVLMLSSLIRMKRDVIQEAMIPYAGERALGLA